MQHVSGEGDGNTDSKIKPIVLPFLPEHQLYIGLFGDVQNAPFLRQQLLDGNADFEYAFIDATSVVSTKHVLAACFRAINDLVNKRLRSRNVHSEIVYSLSANNNIIDAFRHFGISDTTSSLIAVKVASLPLSHTSTNASDHLVGNVTGLMLPFTDDAIAPLTNVAKVRKLYKLNSSDSGGKMSRKRAPKADGVAGSDATDEHRTPSAMDDRSELEAVILGIMAMKGS